MQSFGVDLTTYRGIKIGCFIYKRLQFTSEDGATHSFCSHCYPAGAEVEFLTGHICGAYRIPEEIQDSPHSVVCEACEEPLFVFDDLCLCVTHRANLLDIRDDFLDAIRPLRLGRVSVEYEQDQPQEQQQQQGEAPQEEEEISLISEE
jgi:hypothetical protein